MMESFCVTGLTARPHTKYAWLANFINLVSVLRENEVHCFFVYDSGYPQEKIQERKNRMEAKSKTEERVCRLEEAIEKYHCTNEVDPILIEFQNKRKIGLPSLLKTSNTINIKSIEFLVDKMRKQMFSICTEDFLLTKQLFDILQIPYCNAPTEAETLCSDLCIQGKVDAVLTADSDVLAYGVPVFLTKFITRDGTCFRVRHDTVLEKLGLSAESFLDFCISCGTDYNQNIFRIGPNKAYKLLQEHKNIEGMEKAGLDVSILNHKRVRELFKEYPRSEVKVPYCGTPDFSALEQFAFKKNIKIDIASLKKPFLQNVIVFEGELETPDDTIESSS
jgi:5'-3' exonuclease